MNLNVLNSGTLKIQKKIKVHQEIYNIIAMDNQPFSIVEDKGFIEQLAN